jgi:hypothetical protein
MKPDVSDYEVREGRDGKMGIYLRRYNIRIATFAADSAPLDELLGKLFDAAASKNCGTEMTRQTQVHDWAVRTFGLVAVCRDERAARFLEEAIELAHAIGLSETMAEAILARVYSRKRGDVPQEIGQSMLTLECLAQNEELCADDLARQEFDRVRALPRAYFVKRQNAKAKQGIGGEAS